MSKISKQLKELRNNPLFNDTKKSQIDYSSYSSQSKKLDPLYQSSSPGINQSFLIYTSNSHTNANNIGLIVPQVTNPLISRGSEKIKKEISSFKTEFDHSSNNGFGSRQKQSEGFNNRPMLNLNRSDLDFSVKEYVMSSPTKKNVVTASIFKDKQHEKRNEMNRKYFSVAGNQDRSNHSYMKANNVVNLMNNQQPFVSRKNAANDEMFHNAFMREMSMWKEKKIMEWKQL